MSIKKYKYNLPVSMLVVTALIGILYLFVIGIVKYFLESSPSALFFDLGELGTLIWSITTIFWSTGLIVYSVYSIRNGIKEKVRLTFKEVKTFISEVIIGFVGTWCISSLMVVNIFTTINRTDKTLIKTETIQLTTHLDKKEKHSGGSRGGSYITKNLSKKIC